MSEEEDWEIEQPCPVILISARRRRARRGTRHLVAAEGVEALDLVGRGRGELATVARRAVVVEDDLAVEVIEVRHDR
jgi:hypothetical protein